MWRYILVDIQSESLVVMNTYTCYADVFTEDSRTGNPTRVFIERTQDVREGEAAMRWY